MSGPPHFHEPNILWLPPPNPPPYYSHLDHLPATAQRIGHLEAELRHAREVLETQAEELARRGRVYKRIQEHRRQREALRGDVRRLAGEARHWRKLAEELMRSGRGAAADDDDGAPLLPAWGGAPEEAGR